MDDTNELTNDLAQSLGHKNSAEAANNYLDSPSDKIDRSRVLAFLIDNPGSTGREVDFHFRPDNLEGTFSYSSVLSSLRESGEVAGEKGICAHTGNTVFHNYVTGKPSKQEEARTQKKRLAELGFKNLNEYLNSQIWSARRNEYWKLNRRKCFVTNATKRLELHHLNYKNLGNEVDDDLVPLADGVHKLLHELIGHRLGLGNAPMIMAKIYRAGLVADAASGGVSIKDMVDRLRSKPEIPPRFSQVKSTMLEGTDFNEGIGQ